MNGKRALVTAGATHEYIDSVRFLSNASSGKMGYAIAEELAQRGAAVELVSGPTALVPHHPNITLSKVCSAKEMYDACLRIFPAVDIAVLVAAVADFTPEITSPRKIKRGKTAWTLTLMPTADIAATLGTMKRDTQTLVGFALEDADEIENAERKLKSKNLDMIVLNSLRDAGAGFGTDTNKITIIERSGAIMRFALKIKELVAEDIVETIINIRKHLL